MATIIVTWTAAGGTNVASQTVKRSIAGANSYSSLATVGPTVTTYTDNTAANNTLYDYQVITNCNSGGPTVNLGANPQTIYIDCGSLNSSTAIQTNYQGTAYPEISWTIPARTGTNTKIYSWVWKQAATAQTYTYTVNTQNAVSGTFDSDDFNGNFLSWSTTYTLEVVFRSTKDTHTRTCTFDVTTPAQVVCANATGLSSNNQYTTDFSY